jgi:hypothetical protein
MHTTVAEPGTPSKSLSITETRTSFSQSTKPAFMIFLLLISPWTKGHLMSTQNRASRRSLRNQTVGIKTWVRATEYHPIQQTPGKRCTVPFAGGAFRNSSLQPDQGKLTSGRSSSSLARNPRTATKNKARPAAPTPLVPPTGSPGKWTAARIMRTTAEPSGGGGRHRSTETSMATDGEHQAPAK